MKVQEVLMRAINHELSWIQAAEILGCTTRSLRRWKWKYEQLGVHGLVDGRTRGTVRRAGSTAEMSNHSCGCTGSAMPDSTCDTSARSLVASTG